MAPGRVLFTLAASLALASAGSADIYKWTDRGGVVHYTSDINQVPASQRDLARASGGTGKGSVQRISSERKAPSPEAPATPPGSPASPAAAPAEERIGGRTEAEWREAAEQHRLEIAQLEEREAACANDAFRWTHSAGRDAYDEEAAEADACRRVKSDLSTQRMQLERLEENAQRAAVPPGWLRE